MFCSLIGKELIARVGKSTLRHALRKGRWSRHFVFPGGLETLLVWCSLMGKEYHHIPDSCKDE